MRYGQAPSVPDAMSLRARPFRAPVSPPPAGVTPAERDAYRAVAQARIERFGRSGPPGKSWQTTGEIGVPGWVLGEMADEGLIEHRKPSPSAPNEWRR